MNRPWPRQTQAIHAVRQFHRVAGNFRQIQKICNSRWSAFFNMGKLGNSAVKTRVVVIGLRKRSRPSDSVLAASPINTNTFSNTSGDTQATTVTIQ